MNNRFSLNDFRHRDDFEDFDDFDDEPIETLDHNTRQRILELLAKGCERREVARRVGLTLNELETAGALDPGFERRMTVAEARFDMRVLIALGEAIRHDKNWQLAAWFLDRGTPPTPLPFALREQLAAARFPEVFDRDALHAVAQAGSGRVPHPPRGDPPRARRPSGAHDGTAGPEG